MGAVRVSIHCQSARVYNPLGDKLPGIHVKEFVDWAI